jgi:hypothetical protein
MDLGILFGISLITGLLSIWPASKMYFRDEYYKTKVERAITTPIVVPTIAVLTIFMLGPIALLGATSVYLFRDKERQSLLKKMYRLNKSNSLDELTSRYEAMKQERHRRLEKEIRQLERGL